MLESVWPFWTRWLRKEDFGAALATVFVEAFFADDVFGEADFADAACFEPAAALALAGEREDFAALAGVLSASWFFDATTIAPAVGTLIMSLVLRPPLASLGLRCFSVSTEVSLARATLQS